MTRVMHFTNFPHAPPLLCVADLSASLLAVHAYMWSSWSTHFVPPPRDGEGASQDLCHGNIRVQVPDEGVQLRSLFGLGLGFGMGSRQCTCPGLPSPQSTLRLLRVTRLTPTILRPPRLRV
ncbi:hypothetical protein BV20DRAFT_813336 [Pilatotrama ljubarskyi]|nr:hypothetical protein BV20DRAFT_813336 [Pilatotrama ljubarskyi]